MSLSNPTILRFDLIDSTNLEAMRQAKAGAAEGLCIVAREQTQGRGRLDRNWQSPKDAGLYCSLVLRPRLEINAWPLITLMTALAVCDALVKACGLRADIKWPNDLQFNQRKLGGILAETAETEKGHAVVVGIGINLKADSLPAAVSDLATSVEEATSVRTDSDRILPELLKALAQRYELLQSPLGGEHTIREWCANSSYAIGRQVRVALENDTFEGTTRGLESDGALRVEVADGKIRSVRAGDVTALRTTKNV
jgi:BirA family transcriptional regulator, biotin operon repressor / biotin---[acetyl-CoA-carboxylase] ligase